MVAAAIGSRAVGGDQPAAAGVPGRRPGPASGAPAQGRRGGHLVCGPDWVRVALPALGVPAVAHRARLSL